MRGGDETPWTEDAVERALRELGPLMDRQERRAGDAPDPLFANVLRAHLVAAPGVDAVHVDGVDERAIASASEPPAIVGGRARRLGSVGSGAGKSRRGRRARPARPAVWIGVAAAILAGLFASGALRHAWAALRQLLFFVPGIGGAGVGQQGPTALVLASPASTGAGTLTLTVTGLVSGRRATLVAYTLSRRALAAPAGSAPVADAVEATVSDGRGRSFAPRYWFPVTRGLERGAPAVSGLLAFPALDAGTRIAVLRAAQLPLAPPGRPWTLRLALHPAGSGGVQTSYPVDSGATRHGVRVAVTDVTLAGRSIVVDMATTIEGGPLAGGRVVSLEPGQAVGGLAPTFSTGTAAGTRTVAALVSPLPAPLDRDVLPRPEFVFPTTIRTAGGADGAARVTVPAVAARAPGAATIVVRAGSRGRAVRVGPATIAVAHGRIVAPPAALGLGDERRLELTLAFPPARPDGALESVDVVVDGVGRTVSRDDPRVEIPLAAGQQAVRVTLANPLVSMRGPWTLTVRRP